MDIINVMVLYQSVLHERYVSKSEGAIVIKLKLLRTEYRYLVSFKRRHKVFYDLYLSNAKIRNLRADAGRG